MSPRAPRVLAFTCTLAFIALLTLFVLISPTRAVAGDEPLALGSVSGTIRNAQGDPLPNIAVQVVDPTGYAEQMPVNTNSAGQFLIPSVPPGAYTVRADDPTGQYARQFYRSGGLVSEGEFIPVSGNAVTGIEMVLDPASTLAVELKSEQPSTLNYLNLRLYRQHRLGAWFPYTSTSEYFESSHVFTQTTAVFGGLPAGTYRTCVDTSGPGYPLAECYDDVFPALGGSPAEYATHIPIAVGETRQITFVFGDIAHVQGTIVSETGDPVPNTWVNLTSNGYDRIASLQADAAGHFQFALPIDHLTEHDKFALLAEDPSNNHLSAYYPGTPGFREADWFRITTQTRISLTLALPKSAKISGNVRVEGGGIPVDVQIRVAMDNPPTSWINDTCLDFAHCPRWTYDPVGGRYTVTRLAPGAYYIRAESALGYAYAGGPAQAEADKITVAKGKTVEDADIVIGQGDFEGAITGRVTVNGTPQAGIEVGLFSTWQGSSLPNLMMTTDAQGSYRFEGLQTGSYQVGFRDPQGRYALEFYRPPCSDPCGNWVRVEGSQVVTNVNADLQPGTTIRGQVRGRDGKPAPLARVQLVTELTILPPLGFMEFETDAQGRYTTTALAPRTYLVQAALPPDYDDMRWYSVDPVRLTPSAVTLFAGTHVSGIDISFAPRKLVYLPAMHVTQE